MQKPKWTDFVYPVTVTITGIFTSIILYGEITLRAWYFIILMDTFWLLIYIAIYIYKTRN